MEKKPLLKYHALRDKLAGSILAGEYLAGQRLPAERDLALEFGVSHMTARHAVTDLVESELLERRPGSGIYVRPHSFEKLSTVTLHLICTADDSSVANAFLRAGSEHAGRLGWRTSVTRLHHGYERPTVKSIQSGEPALVLLDFPDLWLSLSSALQKAKGRSVLIGNRMDRHGVPSVLANDRLGIEMAVNHLKTYGHRNIALVSNNPDHPVDRIQIAAWRSCFDTDCPPPVLERRLIVVNVRAFDSRAKPTYEAVKHYLADPGADATAMICLDAEMAVGALAACHEIGRAVPKRMSLINSGDSELMEFANPPVTAIDIDMTRHVELAMEMIQAALVDALPEEDRVRLVQPKLISRQSIAAPQTL